MFTLLVILSMGISQSDEVDTFKVVRNLRWRSVSIEPLVDLDIVIAGNPAPPKRNLEGYVFWGGHPFSVYFMFRFLIDLVDEPQERSCGKTFIEVIQSGRLFFKEELILGQAPDRFEEFELEQKVAEAAMQMGCDTDHIIVMNDVQGSSIFFCSKDSAEGCSVLVYFCGVPRIKSTSSDCRFDRITKTYPQAWVLYSSSEDEPDLISGCVSIWVNGVQLTVIRHDYSLNKITFEHILKAFIIDGVRASFFVDGDSIKQ